MPIWLSILVSIAIRLGMPYLLKLVPGLPAGVLEEIQALIAALTADKKQHRARRKSAIRNAKARIRSSAPCT